MLLLERYNWRSTAYLTGGHSGAVRVIAFSPNGKCQQAEVLHSLPVSLPLCRLNTGGHQYCAAAITLKLRPSIGPQRRVGDGFFTAATDEQ